MGKRINPNNLRLQAYPFWTSYLPLRTYSENFLIYIFCYKWCKALFKCFIDLNIYIFSNKVFLTVYFYLPLKKVKKFLRLKYKSYYSQILFLKNKWIFFKIVRKLQKRKKFFKNKYKKKWRWHWKRLIVNFKFYFKRLTFQEKKNIFFQFKLIKVLYYIYQRFFIKQVLNKYKHYLEKIFFQVFKKRFCIRLINYADLFYNNTKHKTLEAIFNILRYKLGSFHRRFNRNYIHIIKLLSLCCYLKEPKILVLVIRKLFRNPRRNFLVLRLIKTFMDLMFIINPKILGMKIQIKGKFRGKLRTRVIKYQKGRIPVQTINANVKYAFTNVSNRAGLFGIRVWFYLGTVHAVTIYGTQIGTNLLILDKHFISRMVIKNFFKTWLDEKTRRKRREQSKIKIKKKTDYDFIRKPKNTKKKIKKQLR